MEAPEPIASTSSPRQSKIFCETYGDFALRSSEGIVFFISRFLLAYSSPVFSDMFNLAASLDMSKISEPQETDSTRQFQAIQVTEDAVTLDLLLHHIDPKQTIPPINAGTIRRLLEAARKYQLFPILSWFEEEAMKYVEYPNHPIAGQSLMSFNPLLVLSLATEYDLTNLARQAACAIITGEASLLQKDVNIRLDIYRHVCGLREERVQWYVERIGSIASKLHRGKPVQPGTCSCSNTRSSWIHKLLTTVLKTPKWKAFADEVSSPTRRCRPGCGEWAGQVEEDMMVWSHQAAQLESNLPNLPF